MTTGRSAPRPELLLAVIVILTAPGCGRSRPDAQKDLAKLQITRYRFNIDEEHKTARIMAEITNFGSVAIRETSVTAVLRGPGGEARGENTVTVTDIKPGASKVFSVRVTPHGRERDVDFRIGDPEGSPERRLAE